MTSGNLAAWKLKEGDSFSAGDVLAEVETDKATVDYETVDDGFIAKILVQEGAQDIAINTPIAVIVEDAADIAAFKDYVADAADGPGGAAAPAAAAPAAAPAASPAAAPAAPAAPSAPVSSPSTTSAGGQVPASPLARQLAAQMGVNLASIAGTGPGGRVIAADVTEAPAQAAEAVASAAAAPPPAGSGVVLPGQTFVDLPHSNIRKVTAKRMVENKNSNPHYYLTMEVCMDELIAMRAQVNELVDVKTSVNDFVIKACAKALVEVPVCNSSWSDEYIRQYSAADISVAVSTERGLLTPIIFGADTKSVAEISKDVKHLAGKAKDGSIKPDEFMGGTFTVSNLGMFGIKQFTAIINAPQACILAVGGTEKKVVANDGPDAATNPFIVKSIMTVTLSSDHRVVDGSMGATWLKSFKKHMEAPLALLL